MTRLGIRKILFAGAAFGALVVGTVSAQAGGIAIREQSASGQGMSFAGEGTSSMGLSAMFWNPAAVTQTNSFDMESHTAFFFGHTVETALPGTNNIAAGASSGNISEFAYLPSFYAAYKLNPNWYLGVSVNPDFGSGTHPKNDWAGTFYTKEARLKTLDFNPVIGYKVNDQLSIAAGPRIVWLFNGKFSQHLTAPAPPGNAELNNLGDIAYGWTAGLTYKPTNTTEIALGYRSRVNVSLDGNITSPAGSGPVTGDVTLPDQINFGIKQKLDSRWTALGTVEWTHWNLVQTVPFTGASSETLFFKYKNGWFFSAGLEYEWDSRTTLRGGVAYEISPSTDQFRLLGVPDDNRWWFSANITQKWTDRLTTDIGYSFVWLGDSPISYIPGVNPNASPAVFTVLANSHTYNNIVAVSLRYKFDPESRIR